MCKHNYIVYQNVHIKFPLFYEMLKLS